MKRKTKAEKKAKRDRKFASYATQRRVDEDPLGIPPFLQISRERRKAAWREFDARRTKQQET
jgi:hypothetical protein